MKKILMAFCFILLLVLAGVSYFNVESKTESRHLHKNVSLLYIGTTIDKLFLDNIKDTHSHFTLFA